MKKLMMAAALVAITAAGADASERGGCRSEDPADLTVGASGPGGALGKIVDLALSMFAGANQCTEPEPDPEAARREDPGRVRMKPAAFLGGMFQCPSHLPVLRCDWTGWCWCALY